MRETDIVVTEVTPTNVPGRALGMATLNVPLASGDSISMRVLILDSNGGQPQAANPSFRFNSAWERSASFPDRLWARVNELVIAAWAEQEAQP